MKQIFVMLAAGVVLAGCAGFDWGQVATQLSTIGGFEAGSWYRENSNAVRDYEARLVAFDVKAFDACMKAAQDKVDAAGVEPADAAAAFVPCRDMVSSNPPMTMFQSLLGMVRDEPAAEPAANPIAPAAAGETGP